MANFMKRNGKWQARVSWRDANGKLHQKSKVGFAGKQTKKSDWVCLDCGRSFTIK